MHVETLTILDYGSQYTQLIARAARELGVFSIILPYTATAAEIAAGQPKGIILSGGPSSVFDKGAPQLNQAVLEMGIPILGICYGMQLLAHNLGGKVAPSTAREYGKATLQLTGQAQTSRLLQEEFDSSTIWMSHGTEVTAAPEGFAITGKSGKSICVIEDPELGLFGLQFHPEVVQSEYGQRILDNFIGLCGFARNWSTKPFIPEQIANIRQTVGDAHVICALSGGVDSSVAAMLVDKAIGKQQTCIFVDNGLLRLHEFDEILAAYKQTGLNVKPVRAGKQFLAKLQGLTDPEQKRKIIGSEFVRIFEAEAKKIKNVQFLVQGTLYPDVITSHSVKGPSATIKSHHNVGGLPETMKLALIEPLRELFKDEVRALGKELGLPASIVGRQPFPGPGLGVRVVGEITPERVSLLQQADAIVREEIDNHPVRKELYQYFAVLLPVKSVGVMGDGRTYENAVVVKAFHSRDIMTAQWAYLPQELLATISSRIVSEVRGINRVVYEITSKPPATIEWE